MKLVMAVVGVATLAQGPSQDEQPANPCGDPNMVSQAYIACVGKVVDVLDGRTLLMEFNAPCSSGDHEWNGRVRVRLVQLETPPLKSELGRRSKAALAARVMGTIVQVLPSPFQKRGLLIAMVGPGDQSIAQLEAGLASYRDYGPYAVDWYLACVYKRAQDRARSAGLGIWGAK
jgi:endonuclease YncB( thermonuclease family)